MAQSDVVSYSVGEVASMAGVTVRMLHHYDEIRLLCPSSRSEAGYRLYDDADVARVRRILTYRALGFSLGEIAAIVDDPRADTGTHLRRQHHLLTDRISRLTEMVARVEKALEEHEMSESRGPKIVPAPEEQIELLGEVAFPDEWAEGVVAESGDSPELAESARRTSGYTTEDWRQITDEEQEICRRLADAKANELAPESTATMDLAEEHRLGLRRWFFDCTPELHVAFAYHFQDDERMRASFEGVARGLTEYLRAAIHANADRMADRP
ncbi:MAG: MerR family transcriptional regulator [Acidimicrobiales bacterium]